MCIIKKNERVRCAFNKLQYNTDDAMMSSRMHKYRRIQNKKVHKIFHHFIVWILCCCCCGDNVGGKYLELCVGLSCAINFISFTCSSLVATTFFYVLFFFTLFMFCSYLIFHISYLFFCCCI